MYRALIDTSTFLDIQRAGKNKTSDWAQNTLRHRLTYKAAHDLLTVSAFTVFELLDGMHRKPDPNAVEAFRAHVAPALDVLYPDNETVTLAASISATLAVRGQGIGVVDTFIAATALTRDLVLVSANTKHFSRVEAAGFPITLLNWRNP